MPCVHKQQQQPKGRGVGHDKRGLLASSPLDVAGPSTNIPPHRAPPTLLAQIALQRAALMIPGYVSELKQRA